MRQVADRICEGHRETKKEINRFVYNFNTYKMAKIRKYANSIERFLQGEGGQRFFNFAYSIGAAVVICGALFMILHLPGGGMLLGIGMGTEALMFLLSAFDRPPKEQEGNMVIPVVGKSDSESIAMSSTGVPSGELFTVASPGGAVVAPAYEGGQALPAGIDFQSEKLNDFADRLLALEENTAEQMETLNRNIHGLNSMYELQLKNIASQLDAIERVNRGLKDIRDMYEKSANGSTEYCRETEKMVDHLRKLNSIYENVIRAMSANLGGMYGGSPAREEFDKTERAHN